MHDIKVEDISCVVWDEGLTPDRLGSVEITYKNGEKTKYEGNDLVWVVPQIKDHSPSKRPNLLSDTKYTK
jgi:hypothetical protein